jgi:hypothetical protein
MDKPGIRPGREHHNDKDHTARNLHDPVHLWRRVGLAIFVAFGVGVYRVSQIANTLTLPEGEEEVAAIRVKAEAQNEEAFYRPDRKLLQPQEANPLKNVYFGDFHVHTGLSMDAYLFGNRFDVDTAYRMAKCESAALTDHAEGLGRRLSCANPGLDKTGRKLCMEM